MNVQKYNNGIYEYSIHMEEKLNQEYIVLDRYLDEEFSGEITIPSMLDGLNVSFIGSNCFSRSRINKVNIPSSIVRLGFCSFVWCHNLEYVDSYRVSINVPTEYSGDLKEEWLEMYYGQESRERFYSIEYGSSYFKSCENLKKVDLSSTGILLFDSDCFDSEYLTSIIFPGIKYLKTLDIKSKYEWDTPNLETVVFPNLNIKSTFQGPMFLGSNKIKPISLPYQSIIYGKVFNYNVKILNISEIPTINFLGSNTFDWYNPYGSELILNQGVLFPNLNQFESTEHLSKLIIEEDVTFIPNVCFYKCYNLEELTIKSSKTQLENNSFGYCTNVKKVYLPSINYLFSNITLFFPDAKYYFDDVNYVKDIDLEANLFLLFKNCTYNNTVNIYNLIKQYITFDFGIRNKEFVTYIKYLIKENCSIILKEIGSDGFFHKSKINEYIDYAKEVSSNECLLVLMEWKNLNVDIVKERTLQKKKDIETLLNPDAAARLNFNFRLVESVGMSVGYKGTDKAVKIPRVYKNVPVTTLRKNSFSKSKFVKSVVLPDSLLRICDSSFIHCSDLEIINFPENLTVIEDRAFNHCTSLKSIALNDELRSIGMFAFSGCNNLDKVVLGNKLELIDKYAFSNTNIKSIDFKDSDPVLKNGIFMYCSSLEEVILPKNAISITRNMFVGCYELRTIEIPDTVKDIYSSAFKGCVNLGAITIPKSVYYISKDAFDYCDNLILRVTKDSVGHLYALESNIKFEFLS